MPCPQYLNSIQERLDGTLGPIRRAELELHLDQCEDCRALLADLERIRDAAGSLRPLQPPERVWLQVAGRLRQEGRVHDEQRPSLWARRRAPLIGLAAAAVLLIATSILLLAPGSTKPPATAAVSAPAPQGATASADVQSVETELNLAEQHYEAAIARLQQITASDKQALDPQVAATLQKNVQIVDQAIAESRAALRAEPGSAPARDSLFDALRQKVALLQDTITLMNEMRKGNNAAAAQLLNKS